MNSKKLKLILNILICILIILAGLAGIYIKDSNMYENILPGYTLGSDINGITILEFEVDDTEEIVYYDEEGNEIDASTITEENEKDYKKETILVNAKENLNPENYNKAIKIMEKRLEFLGVDQYQLDLDEETGKILLSVEDDYIADVESILPMEAKLQLIDSKTEDIIIDYTDFKSVEATYASLTTEVITYINLKLNDSGLEKINNIDKYKIVEPTETIQENDEEAQESTLIVKFDNEQVAEVSYDDILLNGKTLRVTTASGLTSDTDINSQLNMNTVVSKLATMGKLAVIYQLTAEEFIKNDMGDYINYIIIVLIAICIILSMILILKYKLNGLLAVLGFVTNISLFLTVIRLTKVQVSLNGFAGMIGLISLNMLLANNILKSIKENEKTFFENIKNAYLKTLDVIVIMLIIFIVFAFSSMTVINSMGLLLFWGWAITVLGNLIFTVPMLSITTKK